MTKATQTMTSSAKAWRDVVTVSSDKGGANLGLHPQGQRMMRRWKKHVPDLALGTRHALARPSLSNAGPGEENGRSVPLSTSHWRSHSTNSLLSMSLHHCDSCGGGKSWGSCSWLPYRHNELLHAVGGHTVEVGEVQLEMDLVVEHVLAQGATEGGLHRVLGHGMHPEPVDVGVAVLAVGTLVHLWGTHPALGLNLQFPLATASAPNPPKPKNVHSTAPLQHSVPQPASPALLLSPRMVLAASKTGEARSCLGKRHVWRRRENLAAPFRPGWTRLEEREKRR